MPPQNSHDFLRIAAHKLITADFLLQYKYTLDAQYLGGYAVECALKALILHNTPQPQKSDVLRKISSGASMHRADVLLGVLGNSGIKLTFKLASRMRKFDWTTDLRYETERKDLGQTRGFLKTATQIYRWVQGQMR